MKEKPIQNMDFIRKYYRKRVKELRDTIAELREEIDVVNIAFEMQKNKYDELELKKAIKDFQDGLVFNEYKGEKHD